jgi:magnesium transporter
MTAEQAISRIRQEARTAEMAYYVYVADEDERFRGVLSLHELVMASPETPVRDLMVGEPISVHVDTDQEDAARLLIRRHLLAIPVIDADDRLVGIITENDVADVLEEEATEDIERLGGSQPLATPYRHASVFLLFRKRIVWLLALFIAEAYTGNVMRIFEDELAQVVALAFFIPLLLGTGGNIGSQITTTLVRAMAVEDLTLRDVRWVLAKETGVGLVIGGVMALVAYGRAEILGVGSDVAMVVAITIAIISIWSSVVAAVLPMLLRKLRFDPTVVSAPFITTLVDGTGLVLYFTIAKLVLDL